MPSVNIAVSIEEDVVKRNNRILEALPNTDEFESKPTRSDLVEGWMREFNDEYGHLLEE